MYHCKKVFLYIVYVKISALPWGSYVGWKCRDVTIRRVLVTDLCETEAILFINWLSMQSIHVKARERKKKLVSTTVSQNIGFLNH